MIDKIFEDIENSTHPKYNICGLTSPKSQHFLNRICKNKNVLEIGYYKGASTVPMALSAKSVIAVDDLSMTETIPILNINIGNNNETFSENLKKYNVTNVTTIVGDIFSEEVFNTIKKHTYDVIFYDASHTTEDILKFLILYESIINNTIVIFDDYNFESVQTVVDYFINIKRKYVIYKKEIITDGESLDDYWNGLGVYILKEG